MLSIPKLKEEYHKLLVVYDRLVEELVLLKRRMFIAKAERVDSRQLALEFEQKLRQLDELAGTLGMGQDQTTSADGQGPTDDDVPAALPPVRPPGAGPGEILLPLPYSITTM